MASEPVPPQSRLSNASLPGLPAEVARPAYDRAATRIGVVHFGPGAFHRAHQAAYLDALLADEPRNATCIAATEVELYMLDKAEFQRAIETSPSFRQQIQATYFQRQ